MSIKDDAARRVVTDLSKVLSMQAAAYRTPSIVPLAITHTE